MNQQKPDQAEALYQKVMALLLNEQPRLSWHDGALEQVSRCLMLIHQQVADHALDVPCLARQCAMSERQLYREFKRIIGITPNTYLNQYRLHSARLWLLRGAGIADAAALSGFGSANYFSRQYKKLFGLTPSEQRALSPPGLEYGQHLGTKGQSLEIEVCPETGISRIFSYIDGKSSSPN